MVEHLHQGSRVIVIGRAETIALAGLGDRGEAHATRVIVDNHGTVGLALPTLTRNPRPDGVGGE